MNTYFVTCTYRKGTFPKGKPQTQTLHIDCNTYAELIDKVYSDPDVIEHFVQSIKTEGFSNPKLGKWVARPINPSEYDIK